MLGPVPLSCHSKGYSAVLLLAIWGLTGCETVHYYDQAIRGEAQILRQRQPITRLIADPHTGDALKEKFGLVLRLRDFARTDLKLPVDKHYASYVDLGRRFAVWNVHAAPQFSLEPKKWWYPLVGSLKYRGYFFEADARAYGEQLDAEGYDVYVEGVEAYSTLGWFADPLLNTFIRHSEGDVAEILFHELAHQRLFLSGDTDFNEAFATAVSEQAVRLWFDHKSDAVGYREYQLELEHNRQIVALVMGARRRLKELYGDPQPRASRPREAAAPASWERGEKQRIIAELRQDYQQLKHSWGGDSGYDSWFANSLNNAQLNTIAVYYELVPGFQVLLARDGGDLERFYKSVKQFRKLSKAARHRRLKLLGTGLSSSPAGVQPP